MELPQRGFAIGDNGSRFGKKGHELGVTRRWTPEEARYFGRTGGRPKKQEDTDRRSGAGAHHASLT
jgi:hypothetical protein